jgi:hypothetical protein
LPEPSCPETGTAVLRGPQRGNASGLPDEIFFGIITRQAIRCGTFTSVKDLTAAIGAFIDAYNDRCSPFAWTKDADELIAKSNRQRTNATRH